MNKEDNWKNSQTNFYKLVKEPFPALKEKIENPFEIVIPHDEVNGLHMAIKN